MERKEYKIEESVGLRGVVAEGSQVFTLTKCYDGCYRWINEKGFQANPCLGINIINEKGEIIDSNPRFV